MCSYGQWCVPFLGLITFAYKKRKKKTCYYIFIQLNIITLNHHSQFIEHTKFG